MKEEIYIIEGMSCAACSSSVERVTRKIEGVESSNVNLATSRMTITYDEKKVNPEMIKNKVIKAGFGIKPEEHNGSDDTVSMKQHISTASLITSLILAVLLLYVSMGQMLFKGLWIPDFFNMHKNPLNYATLQLIITIPVLIMGRYYFINGFKALFHLNANMNSLVAISCSVSFIFSVVLTCLIPSDNSYVHHLYFESSAVVLTLIMLGKYLETRSRQKTGDAINKLLELTPPIAFIVENDIIRTIPSSELKVNDIVLIKSGLAIPADGDVIEGSTSTDESLLTGESIPVEKNVGSSVIGGSINLNGTIKVKVTRTGNDSTLKKIVDFVRDAQGKKAPIAKLADKVSGVFVPIVMCIALISGIIWFFAGEDVFFCLRIFTSVLVIACPCALGLATPTAILVGTGLGASHQILIRSGEILEITHGINTVVLDKTGTVTEGKPQINAIVTHEFLEEKLLKLAATAEAVSSHPLAAAICNHAKDENIPLSSLSSYQYKTGMGLSAVINEDIHVLIGSKRFISEEGINTDGYEAEEKKYASSNTLVYIAVDNHLEGFFSISDKIKESSIQAVNMLKSLGIKVILLTGDKKNIAENVGSQIKADMVISQVLPEDKANVISTLQQDNSLVLMVGDGINDAPALTQADVGCAIGNGSDIAIDSADIILMKNDLLDCYRAIKLSKLTIRNIRQNLFWAFCYNIIGIPIAAGVLYPINGLLLSPMIAGLAMSLSSICVVTNALRLKYKKL